MFCNRNTQHELHDIKFEFKPEQDTPDGIAQELVGAGLVNGMDKIIGKISCIESQTLTLIVVIILTFLTHTFPPRGMLSHTSFMKEMYVNVV